MNLQQQYRTLLEQIKEFTWFVFSQIICTGLGEVTGVDATNHLVQVLIHPSPPKDVVGAVVGPWLPQMVPVLGVRSLPNIGDQAIILYMMNSPLAIIGYTYNSIDLPEETVAINQYRISMAHGATEADLLVDGNDGHIILNKGTHSLARVGDTVSVSGTVSLSGTDSRGDTVTVSGLVTLVGTITTGSINAFN